jgi:urocanate hydratase
MPMYQLVVLCVDVARSNINTKHNKYNRHATTNQIILSLVNEEKKKKKNISLRMVKNLPKHVGEF